MSVSNRLLLISISFPVYEHYELHDRSWQPTHSSFRLVTVEEITVISNIVYRIKLYVCID